MTDIYDRASDIEEAYRAQAIARQRAKTAGPDLRNIDCMDCGVTIDPARLDAVRNCLRCIDCARADDARHKWRTR